MKRILLMGMLLVGCIAAHSQHGFRLQNSYFLTGLPLFGAGYEYASTSPFTYGAHLEFGMYDYHYQDLINAAWESYSVRGLALMPEVRWYPFHKEGETFHRSIFLAGFAHLRRLKEYTMDDPLLGPNLRTGASYGGGAAIGYRTACGDTPLFVEILIGMGKARAVWHTPLTPSDARDRAGSYDPTTLIYRFELAVGYRFVRG